MTIATSFLRDHDFIQALYLVSVILFIIGLRGLAGPKTAPTGNKIAAVGMLIAIVATLLIPGVVPDGEIVHEGAKQAATAAGAAS